MAQAKGKGKSGNTNVKYGAKITIEIIGKIPKENLRDLLESLGSTLNAKLENGP